MARRSEAVKKAQQDLAAAFPWVTRYRQSPGRCEAPRWGAMSFKRMDEARRTGETPEAARCKRAAWWRYRALKKSHAWQPDAQLCWEHCAQQTFHYSAESDRVQRWLARHPEAVPAVLREYWGETPGEDD